MAADGTDEEGVKYKWEWDEQEPLHPDVALAAQHFCTLAWDLMTRRPEGPSVDRVLEAANDPHLSDLWGGTDPCALPPLSDAEWAAWEGAMAKEGVGMDGMKDDLLTRMKAACPPLHIMTTMHKRWAAGCLPLPTVYVRSAEGDKAAQGLVIASDYFREFVRVHMRKVSKLVRAAKAKSSSWGPRSYLSVDTESVRGEAMDYALLASATKRGDEVGSKSIPTNVRGAGEAGHGETPESAAAVAAFEAATETSVASKLQKLGVTYGDLSVLQLQAAAERTEEAAQMSTAAPAMPPTAMQDDEDAYKPRKVVMYTWDEL